MHFRRWLLLLLSIYSSGFIAVVLLAWNGYTFRHRIDAEVLPQGTFMGETIAVDDSCVSTLPFKVEGTELVVEQLVSYEGEFLENDTLGYVVNTTGILLRNAGKDGVCFAEICLKQNGQEYAFLAEYIPAGMTALVLEKDGKGLIPDASFSCNGFAVCDSDVWLPKMLAVEPIDKGDLILINNSDAMLKHICVYYRTCYNGGGFYLGGRVHCCCIGDVKPGERRRISPKFYAGEYSEIVRIRI